MPVTKETITETFHLDPETVDRVIDRVKDLVHEGNVRSVILKNADGRTIIEAPLTVGVIGAALVPVWAAIAAVVAIVADCTVTVVKREEPASG